MKNMTNTDNQFYTAFIVADIQRRATLQNTAYSFTTARLGDIKNAYFFHDRKKAQSCASNINSSSSWMWTAGAKLTVIPVQLKRRNKR